MTKISKFTIYPIEKSTAYRIVTKIKQPYTTPSDTGEYGSRITVVDCRHKNKMKCKGCKNSYKSWNKKKNSKKKKRRRGRRTTRNNTSLMYRWMVSVTDYCGANEGEVD